METVADFIFMGSKITVDGDCSHEIKGHLLLGKKAVTNSILENRDTMWKILKEMGISDHLTCLLRNLYAGIKIAGRNIYNLKYADDTTLMAESEEELKILLMKVKEESEKVGLKLNIQKANIMESSPITS